MIITFGEWIHDSRGSKRAIYFMGQQFAEVGIETWKEAGREVHQCSVFTLDSDMPSVWSRMRGVGGLMNPGLTQLQRELEATHLALTKLPDWFSGELSYAIRNAA